MSRIVVERNSSMTRCYGVEGISKQRVAHKITVQLRAKGYLYDNCMNSRLQSTLSNQALICSKFTRKKQQFQEQILCTFSKVNLKATQMLFTGNNSGLTKDLTQNAKQSDKHIICFKMFTTGHKQPAINNTDKCPDKCSRCGH